MHGSKSKGRMGPLVGYSSWRARGHKEPHGVHNAFEFFVHTRPPSGQARTWSGEGLESWDAVLWKVRTQSCSFWKWPALSVFSLASISYFSQRGLIHRITNTHLPRPVPPPSFSSWYSSSLTHWSVVSMVPQGLRHAATSLLCTVKAPKSVSTTALITLHLTVSSLSPLSSGVHSMVPMP